MLNEKLNCTKCNSETTYQTNTNVFRCANWKCQKEISLIAGAIMDNMKLPVSKVIYIIYEWSAQTPVSLTAYEYDLAISTVSK